VLFNLIVSINQNLNTQNEIEKLQKFINFHHSDNKKFISDAITESIEIALSNVRWMSASRQFVMEWLGSYL